MDKKQQIIRFIIYFLLLLPLMVFRDITPTNELKYLSIADEALRDSHFFALFNQGIAYADKPPLYIWIVMLFKWILGYHSTFILALFSLIPGLITLYIFNKWCNEELNKKYQIASELTLLTSAYFLGGALVLRMDMLMTMFITLSMYTFYRIYKGNERPVLKYAFGLYVFLSIFSKGPVGIMVPLFCIPVFLLIKRKFRTIGKYWGWRPILVLVLLCGIWWLCVYLEGGTEYLNNLLFHQTIDRGINAFHHKAPFYYYCYSIWYAMAPWSFLTIGVIIYGLCKKVKLSELTQFMLISAGTIFVMMSIVSAKLVIYILPCFGFLNYGAFLVLEQLECRKFAEGARKVVTYGAVIILVAACIAGCFISKYNYKIGYREVGQEALVAAQEHEVNDFYFYDIPGGESLDVFLGHEVKAISQEEYINPQKLIKDSKGIVIFAKEDGVVLYKLYLKQ